jgi:DNA invertase Pin-like site-specific DNA recombinase
MGKVRAYIRVSTNRQDVENQKLEILKVSNESGLGKVEFVEETVSGRKSWRERKLAGVIDELGQGDVLIVAELSRLGRSMLEIMEILSLFAQRQVKVYASKGNWRLDGSMQSKIIAMVLAMASEIERDLISQRTRAALATKKAAGVKLGRRPGPGRSKLDAKREDILELLELGVPKKRIAGKLGTTYGNLAHWLKMRGLPAR